MQNASPETNPFDEQIDEFESALKSFICVYNFDLVENRTNQELNKKSQFPNYEHSKINIEQIVNELHEKAHNLETLFLKCRHEILKDTPEQIIEEEIQILKAESKRKEDLLNETKEKMAFLENSLRNLDASLDNQLKASLDISTYGFAQK